MVGKLLSEFGEFRVGDRLILTRDGRAGLSTGRCGERIGLVTPLPTNVRHHTGARAVIIGDFDLRVAFPVAVDALRLLRWLIELVEARRYCARP